MSSLYRRPLPDGLVPFSSPEGRQLFGEALADGTLEGYFPVAEQFHTQADPAYCGLGSLVVALNALGVDPGRLWKGPWRWFSEELLDCCVPLSQVQKAGLTLDELSCLAECNGASVGVHRASQSTAAELRSALLASSRSATGPVVIGAYCRSALGQTGSGHFSPIAGYHAGRDAALILDVARFKYPPHWVSVDRLFEAMQPPDPATGQSRGWLELRRSEKPRNLAFVFAQKDGAWQGVARFLNEEVVRLLAESPAHDLQALLARVLARAREVAQGITVRDSSDAQHAAVIEQVLSELRKTEVHRLACAVTPDLPAELAATLLYLVPRGAWAAAPPSLQPALDKLFDIDVLEDPLAADLRTLRGQLARLQCLGELSWPPSESAGSAAAAEPLRG